ncbi:MAG: hypothetical protein K2G27_05090 [Duncaniella sp.]|nr:hypothetical protein [Bacteroides sp.]MDE6066177.1 hypothetical protein [Duncaniella sp.]
MTTPKWVTFLIIIFTLPVFTLPSLLAQCQPDAQATRTLVWIYPFYMLLSAYLAWRAYVQRPYVTWMLLAIMILSSIAVQILVTA